ncbi:hypothetical protein ACRPOS_006990 [Bartonella heixiaziensis]|uniref:hypothetical protein n=1 Tax=Bartonella heixiaziensis TaxID=1461000 RepID=UPI003908A7B8
MIKRIFSIIFLIILFPLFSSVHPTYADPPTVVYRLDGRAPTDIFFNGGFASWGGEHGVYDILFHVSGASVEAQVSAYVSTTSSMDALYRMAHQQLVANPHINYWVYEITPGLNFYHIPSSLLVTALQADNMIQANNVLSLYNMFAWQEEWAAADLIPTESIRLARSVTLQEGQVVFGPPNENPHFIASAPQTNPNHLTSNHYGFLEAYYNDGEDPITAMASSFFIGSCEGSPSSSSHMMKRSLTRDLKYSHNASCAQYKHSAEDVLYKTRLVYEAIL